MMSSSADTPTTSRSPSARALSSSRTCPTWKTSNVPNVMTVRTLTATPLWCSAADEVLGQPALDGVEPDPGLLHGVALADRDCLVLEGVEVDGDAERRADLVLPAVAPADGAGVVELDVPALAQHGR